MVDLGVRESDSCPQNKQWYVCAKGGYSGCCSVDPCTLGFCADDSSSSSSSSGGGGGGGSSDTTASRTTSTSSTSTTTSTSSTSSTTTILPTTSDATTAPTTTTATPSRTTDTSLSTSTSSPTATPTYPSHQPAYGLNKALIAGGVVGGILALVILAALLLYSIHRSRKRRRGQFKLLHWRHGHRGSIISMSISSKGRGLDAVADTKMLEKTKRFSAGKMRWLFELCMKRGSYTECATGDLQARPQSRPPPQPQPQPRSLPQPQSQPQPHTAAAATAATTIATTTTTPPRRHHPYPHPPPPGTTSPPTSTPWEVSPLNERDRQLARTRPGHEGVSPLTSPESTPSRGQRTPHPLHALPPPKFQLKVSPPPSKEETDTQRGGVSVGANADVRVTEEGGRAAAAAAAAELSDTGFYRQRAELPARMERELINVPGWWRRGIDEAGGTGGRGDKESEAREVIVTADGAVMVANIQTVGGDEMFD